MTTLGEATELIATWNPSRAPGLVDFDYIDVGALDSVNKTIGLTDRLTSAIAPSRARQIVETDDVLVSTVRPNLNSVAMVPARLAGATASTGFSVLRAKPGVDPKYLFHWVRSRGFIDEMVRRARGASYPAVSDKTVRESLVPLPRHDEQRRLAGVLSAADGARRARRQAISLVDELTPSIFCDMFPRHQESTSTVAEVVLPGRESVRTGPFGSQLLREEFVDRGVAVLGIDNVATNHFRWKGRRFITPEKYQQLKRYTTAPGDVLITIMGTNGRCAVVPDDIPPAINTKHLCAITVDRRVVLPEFVRACFLWHPGSRQHLLKNAKGAIMDGLNMGIIKAMPLPVPPLDRQVEFVRRARAAQAQHVLVERAADVAHELYASLQHAAFAGQL